MCVSVCVWIFSLCTTFNRINIQKKCLLITPLFFFLRRWSSINPYCAVVVLTAKLPSWVNFPDKKNTFRFIGSSFRNDNTLIKSGIQHPITHPYPILIHYAISLNSNQLLYYEGNQSDAILIRWILRMTNCSLSPPKGKGQGSRVKQSSVFINCFFCLSARLREKVTDGIFWVGWPWPRDQLIRSCNEPNIGFS